MSLIVVMVFSLILISLLSPWLEKRLFVGRLEEYLVERRADSIECRSLAKALENPLRDASPDRLVDQPDYLVVSIANRPAWRVSLFAEDDGKNLFRLRHEEKEQIECFQILPPP